MGRGGGGSGGQGSREKGGKRGRARRMSLFALRPGTSLPPGRPLRPFSSAELGSQRGANEPARHCVRRGTAHGWRSKVGHPDAARGATSDLGRRRESHAEPGGPPRRGRPRRSHGRRDKRGAWSQSLHRRSCLPPCRRPSACLTSRRRSSRLELGRKGGQKEGTGVVVAAATRDRHEARRCHGGGASQEGSQPQVDRLS